MKKYLSLILVICLSFTLVNLPVITASASLNELALSSSEEVINEWCYWDESDKKIYAKSGTYFYDASGSGSIIYHADGKDASGNVISNTPIWDVKTDKFYCDYRSSLTPGTKKVLNFSYKMYIPEDTNKNLRQFAITMAKQNGVKFNNAYYGKPTLNCPATNGNLTTSCGSATIIPDTADTIIPTTNEWHQYNIRVYFNETGKITYSIFYDDDLIASYTYSGSYEVNFEDFGIYYFQLNSNEAEHTYIKDLRLTWEGLSEEPEVPDVPEEPDVPEDVVYKVVVDYTKLNDIEEVADISTTLGSYADVKVTKGRGFEIIQTKSLPVVNNGTNTNASPTVHLGFQGVIEEDAENNTQLRVSKFGGKLKVDMDIDVQNDSYKEPVDGVKVGTPYYAMYYGYTPSMGNETSVTFAHVNYRIRSANATIMNTTKSNDNGMIPNTLRYTAGNNHKFTTYIDTYSKATKVDMDGDVSTGESQLASYFNGIYITGQDRMKVGSYLNIKKIEISLLEENDDYNTVRTKLDSLPASLVVDANAVTENIVLPVDSDIKWTTSDSEICDEYGNITRWYSDRKVTLTATYGIGHTVIHKDYILNIKADETLVSSDILDASGIQITDLVVSGDKVAGSYEVTNYGLKVSKEVADSGEYKVKYPLFGNVRPYNTNDKSLLKATGFSGIFDVGFNITPKIKGDEPVYVNLDNNYLSACGIEVGKDSIRFKCENGKDVALVKESTYGNTYLITLRIDTLNSKVWAFVNGDLKTSSMKYIVDDEEYFVSALNVVVPKTCTENDEVVLNNISVKSFEENTIEVKQKMTDALDSLLISSITNTSENVEYINKLESEINGFNIVWSSNSNLIDLETNKVYHPEIATDVVLSATMYGNGIYVKKDFNLTVAKTDDNVKLLDTALIGLEDYITSQPSGDLRTGITLPEIYNGLDISWESSHNDIINKAGKFVENAEVTKPTEVTLTANVSFKGTIIPKTFKYTVSPFAGNYTVFDGTSAPESFTLNGKENVKLTGNTTVDLKISQIGGDGTVVALDSKGNAIFKIVIKNNTCYIVYGNGSTDKYSIPSGTLKNFKAFVMADVSKIALWYDGTLINDYLDASSVINDLSGFAVTGNGFVVESCKVTTDLYGMLAINRDNINYFAPFAKGVVKEGIPLVTETVVPCDVSWKAEEDSCVKDDGKVEVPDMYQFTSMTLTLSDINMPQVKMELPVGFAVACDKGKNVFAGAKVNCSVMEKPGYPANYATDNDVNTIFGISNAFKTPVITLDMGESNFINAVYLSENLELNGKGIEEYTIKCSDDGINWTVLKKGTINQLNDCLISFKNTFTRYIQIEINKSYSKDVYFNEIEGYLFGTDEDIIGLELDTIDLGIESTVSSDIKLPPKGVFGTELKWSSNMPEIIDENGKVTRPDKGTTVTLTVKIVKDDKTYTRDFAVYVNGKSTSGGSSGGGGGSAGGVSGTGTSNIPGFATTDTIDVKEDEEIQPTPVDKGFKDMDENHWAYENIKKLNELGIVNGDEKGNFNPSQNVTREQFLKMLVETLGIKTTVGTNNFADVDSDAWYCNYISAGVENGIINGITKDVFGVGSSISRQDMAVMIKRVVDLKNIKVEAKEGLFADNSLISDYAKDAVYAVRSSGIIEGYNGMFNPKAYLTRAEAATVIIRLLELLK